MQDGIDLGLFFESWELFREATLAGTLAGGVLGFLGVYVVLRRMVFVSAALSQSSALGVAVAFYAGARLGIEGHSDLPFVLALLFTIAAALLLMTDRTALGLRRESLLGFAYLTGSAGTLAIGTRIVEEHHEIESLLFGSAVAVVPHDFYLLVGLTIALGGLHLWWMRGLLQASFDPDGARVRGLPVRTLELAFLITLAIGISVTTRILGALPVFAFSVLPAMAALRLCVNVPRALFVAAGFGAAAGFGGYLIAFLYELPVGAAQTLTAAALVLVAELARRMGLSV